MRGMNKEDGEMFWYLMVFTALCGAAWGMRKRAARMTPHPPLTGHLPLKGKASGGERKEETR